MTNQDLRGLIPLWHTPVVAQHAGEPVSLLSFSWSLGYTRSVPERPTEIRIADAQTQHNGADVWDSDPDKIHS